MASNAQWTEQHVKYLQGHASLNQQQQRFVELALMKSRSPIEEKQFKAALKLEKLSVQMLKAKAESASIENAAKKVARKARDHELYNSAGLMIVAGLVDTVTGKPLVDKAELLGALMGLAKVPAEDPRRKEWQKAGSDKLQELQKAKPESVPA
jgi:hypothetical protein